MFCFLPCLSSCASEGGLSSYSCPSHSIDCCCLLVPARLVMNAGGIFCFPDIPSVVGPSDRIGFSSIFLSRLPMLFTYWRSCASVQALPQLYCTGEGTALRTVSWPTPEGRSFGVFSSVFPTYLCPTCFQGSVPFWQQWLTRSLHSFGRLSSLLACSSLPQEHLVEVCGKAL